MDHNRLFLSCVAGCLALVTILLGVAGSAAISAMQEQDRSFQLATATYVTRETMEDLLANIRTLRTAQRTYIQTSNAESLFQYQDARTNIRANLDRLWRTEHAPEQYERITRFSQLLADYTAEYQRIVNLRVNGDITDAMREMNNLRGIGQTSALNLLANEITGVKTGRLADKIAATKSANSLAETLLLAGLSLTILVLAGCAFFIIRDLRRRLAAEHAMRESSLRLQETLSFQHALVDSAAYGIIATDARGTITEFNPTAEQMLGYKAENVLNKATTTLFHDPAELAEHAIPLDDANTTIEPGLEIFSGVFRLGEVEEREWTYVRKDGWRVPVHLSVTAIRGNDGRISGYLCIARDITERRKITRLKNEFVSTVSHELRTPLTSIRGSLGLVLGTFGGDLPTQVKGLLQIAHNNADRLGRLINDILDVEKIESGKMEFNMQSQSLSALLRQSIDGTREFARQFHVALDLVDNAAGAEIYVDSDRFIQVMVNLLSNAAKFSPSDQPVITTAERHGGMIRISVADKGKGIPAEFQSRIFKKFAQADSSDSRQKGGTGLGLSITKAILEKMNGLIGFNTVEGHGTTFHVDLPESIADRATNQPIARAELLRNAG